MASMNELHSGIGHDGTARRDSDTGRSAADPRVLSPSCMLTPDPRRCPSRHLSSRCSSEALCANDRRHRHSSAARYVTSSGRRYTDDEEECEYYGGYRFHTSHRYRDSVLSSGVSVARSVAPERYSAERGTGRDRGYADGTRLALCHHQPLHDFSFRHHHRNHSHYRSHARAMCVPTCGAKTCTSTVDCICHGCCNSCSSTHEPSRVAVAAATAAHRHNDHSNHHASAQFSPFVCHKHRWNNEVESPQEEWSMGRPTMMQMPPPHLLQSGSHETSPWKDPESAAPHTQPYHESRNSSDAVDGNTNTNDSDEVEDKARKNANMMPDDGIAHHDRLRRTGAAQECHANSAEDGSCATHLSVVFAPAHFAVSEEKRCCFDGTQKPDRMSRSSELYQKHYNSTDDDDDARSVRSDEGGSQPFSFLKNAPRKADRVSSSNEKEAGVANSQSGNEEDDTDTNMEDNDDDEKNDNGKYGSSSSSNSNDGVDDDTGRDVAIDACGEVDTLDEDNRVSLRTCDMRFPVIITSSVSKRVCGGSTSSCQDRKHSDQPYCISRVSKNVSATTASECDVSRIRGTSITRVLPNLPGSQATDCLGTCAKKVLAKDTIRPSVTERERHVLMSACQESEMWPAAHMTRTNCSNNNHKPIHYTEAPPGSLLSSCVVRPEQQFPTECGSCTGAVNVDGDSVLASLFSSRSVTERANGFAAGREGEGKESTSPIISCEDVYHTVDWIHRINSHWADNEEEQSTAGTAHPECNLQQTWNTGRRQKQRQPNNGSSRGTVGVTRQLSELIVKSSPTQKRLAFDDLDEIDKGMSCANSANACRSITATAVAESCILSTPTFTHLGEMQYPRKTESNASLIYNPTPSSSSPSLTTTPCGRMLPSQHTMGSTPADVSHMENGYRQMMNSHWSKCSASGTVGAAGSDATLAAVVAAAARDSNDVTTAHTFVSLRAITSQVCAPTASSEKTRSGLDLLRSRKRSAWQMHENDENAYPGCYLHDWSSGGVRGVDENDDPCFASLYPLRYCDTQNDSIRKNAGVNHSTSNSHRSTRSDVSPLTPCHVNHLGQNYSTNTVPSHQNHRADFSDSSAGKTSTCRASKGRRHVLQSQCELSSKRFRWEHDYWHTCSRAGNFL